MTEADGQKVAEVCPEGTCGPIQDPNQGSVLTLIQMAGGIHTYMTPKTLNRHNSKWPEVKIFVHLDLFITKCFRIICVLVKVFIQKVFF